MLEQFVPRLQVAEVELTEPAGKVAVRLEVCDGCHTDLYSPGRGPVGCAPNVVEHEHAATYTVDGGDRTAIAQGRP